MSYTVLEKSADHLNKCTPGSAFGRDPDLISGPDSNPRFDHFYEDDPDPKTMDTSLLQF